MSIPQVETFTLRKKTKDSLGMILADVDVEFKGVSDEETVYDRLGGTLNVIGKGTIFTSDESIVPVEGDEVLVDGDVFVITYQFKGKNLGVFHHWEIVYG